MITTHEMELFQSCPAYWKLSKDNNTCKKEESNYLFALRKTIFQMYSWLQEKDKFLTLNQVRERWDKNWWAIAMDSGTLQQNEILDAAANGFMILEKYWTQKYLQEVTLMPVGINFEFAYYVNNLHYQIHVDLILSNPTGDFYLRQFSGKNKEWQMYNSLATKLEIVALTKTLGSIPKIKNHIDLLSDKTQYNETTLNILPNYLNQATTVIDTVSHMIQNHIVYSSPNKSCSHCNYKKQCWF